MMNWMLYSILVATLLALGGLAGERVFRLSGVPTRWVWLAALGLSLGLPVFLPRLVPGTVTALPDGLMPATITLELMLPANPSAAAFPIARILLYIWLGASAGLVLYAGWLVWRLHRSRMHWRSGVLGQASVLFSPDVGPAVVGVMRPKVVVPEWVRSLPAGEQHLILAHEQEHIAARDPWLMLASQLAVLALPWNPALWLQAKRLRECIELDCDARLLARGSAVHGYASLLLDVGARSSRAQFAVAAMAEPRSLLEKRIARMFERRPPRAWLRAGAWALLTVLGVIAACEVPLPGEPTPPPAQEGLTAEPVKVSQSQEPTFTPFTVRPELRNVEEVRAAFERLYPPLLREAGIGGTARLWFYINELGAVAVVKIKKSSGHEALDAAALKIAEVMQFTPAMNRDQRVAVWVDMPIVFRAGSDSADAALRLPPPPPPGVVRGKSTTEPPRGEPDVSAAPTLTPYTEQPELANAAAVADALHRYYPPLLRDAGIGGAVRLWFFVDENGKVQKIQLKQGSGHAALDDAALKVATMIEFVPARNRGEPVKVWIDMPIVFKTQ